MRISKYYLLAFCIAVCSGLLFSCNNEEEPGGVLNGIPLDTDQEFIRLADDNTGTAAMLTVLSSEPEVSLKWFTTPDCNIDTTLSVLKIKGGKGVLPVKWMNKLENGKRGPEDIAYKAGVELTAGEYSKYIPLVWAEEVDSTKILESVRTRSGGVSRVEQITMIPSTVNMNDADGGVMSLCLTNIPYVILDVSEFTPELNIDMAQIPGFITESTILNFKWKAGGAPSFSFSARVVAMSGGLVQTGYVTYTATAPPETLNYASSNLPTGKIPYPGGTYTFTFTGTYPGNVQVRALSGGVVLATGTAVADKQPAVTVPENMTNATRDIFFQYKRADDVWAELPANTVRTQGHPGEGIICGGYTWAPGNLIKVGNVYKFQTWQETYSGVWDGGDYWRWNELDPLAWQNSDLSSTWDNAKDPCQQVAPAGTWRTPTSNELTALANTPNAWGNRNGVAGRYFGPNNEVFLPAAGYRPKAQSITMTGTVGFYWASSQMFANGNVYILGFDSERVNVDYNAHRGNSSQIRCIKAAP